MILGQYINMSRMLSIVNRFTQLNRSIRLNIVSHIFVSFIVSASCFILYGCCGDGTGPGYSASGYFVALFSPQAQTIEIQATNEEYTDISIDTPTGFWYFSEYDHGGTIYEPNTYTYYRHACYYRVHNPTENTESVYMYAKGMQVEYTEVKARKIPSDADTLYDLESENLVDDLVHAFSDDVHNLLDDIDEIIADCPDGVAASHTHCEDVIVVEPGESAAIYFEDAPDNISALSIPENGSSYSFPRPNQETGILGDVFCGGDPHDEVRCSE